MWSKRTKEEKGGQRLREDKQRREHERQRGNQRGSWAALNEREVAALRLVDTAFGVVGLEVAHRGGQISAVDGTDTRVILDVRPQEERHTSTAGVHLRTAVEARAAITVPEGIVKTADRVDVAAGR